MPGPISCCFILFEICNNVLHSVLKDNMPMLIKEKVGKEALFCLYLLRVHGRGTDGVYDHHAGSCVCVDEVSSIALPHTVHHTRLVEVEQSRQVLAAVKRRWVCLGSERSVVIILCAE